MTHPITIEDLSELLAKATLSDLPGYEIRDDGSVWSIGHNWRGLGARALSPTLNGGGYLTVRLTVAGKRIKRTVHSLVARAFNGERPSPHHEVRHLDGVKTHNRPSNLAWGTVAENAADRKRHGTERAADNGRRSAAKIAGSNSRLAKLATDQVLEIRRRAHTGERAWAIARSYKNVSPFTISNIIRRRTWKHV